jgi:hypothetical protein
VVVLADDAAAGTTRRRSRPHLMMAILSMEPGIHGYPTRRARVWRVDHAHGFHGADIHLLMGWAQAQVLPHGYPVDIQLIGGTHMLVRYVFFPRSKR